MTEEWRPVKGYEGLYEVSNIGRVKSVDRYETQKNGITRHRNEKILVLMITQTNRNRVVLCKNGKTKKFFVHQLVAEAFIDNNDKSRKYIHHINHDTLDNSVNNLMWVTNDENMQYELTDMTHIYKNKNDYGVTIHMLHNGKYVYQFSGYSWVDLEDAKNVRDIMREELYMLPVNKENSNG